MKIYEAWDDLKEWLQKQQRDANTAAEADVFQSALDKIEHLECHYE